MKKIFSLILLLAVFALHAGAQRLSVEATLKGKAPEGLQLFLMSIGQSGKNSIDTVHIRGNKAQVSVPVSPYHVYKLVGVAGQSQMIRPLCLMDKKGKASFSFSFKDKSMVVSGVNSDSKALMAFDDHVTAVAKDLWMKGRQLSADSVRLLVGSYVPKAAALCSQYKTSPSITEYMNVWASATTFENLESIRFITGKDAKTLGFDMPQQVKTLCGCLNCQSAQAFDASSRMVLSSVPEGTLSERIARVEAMNCCCVNPELKRNVENALLSKHVSSFNYSSGFEEGLAELKSLTAKYQLDPKWVREFEARRASVSGKPFPAGVDLYDLQGNKVDFAQFRGKYVYVDLWASWCVPCIREIPHLKQLEKELQNPDVVFLSVSVDTSADAWKKKVKQLGLEGNLLNNRDNKLCDALNVKGIPFFLIYDRQGNLHTYNAPRPSDVRLKPLLESLK